jgi:hypothetical protein
MAEVTKGYAPFIGRSAAPLPLLSHEHSQVDRVGRELLPSPFELPHAVGPVGPAALGLVRAHRDDGVDRPFPIGRRAGLVLDADRSDLGLVAIAFQDDAVDVGSMLTMLDLAEV